MILQMILMFIIMHYSKQSFINLQEPTEFKVKTSIFIISFINPILQGKLICTKRKHISANSTRDETFNKTEVLLDQLANVVY